MYRPGKSHRLHSGESTRLPMLAMGLVMVLAAGAGTWAGSAAEAPPSPPPAEAEDGKAPVSAAVEARPWEPGPVTVYRIPVEGIIDLGMAPFVSRVVKEAAAADARNVVLLDINTFGGRVDAAVLIRDALIESPVRTVAFVNPRAISAGALISLACERIIMVPGGSMGAATPVTGGAGEVEAADEKVLSYMRSELRSTAERRGRRGDVAEAMADRDIEIEGVTEAGKLVTLTTDEALRLGYADLEVASLDEGLEGLGLAGSRVEERRLNWAEKLARAVSHPVFSSLLLSLGFLGIMIELYQPGWGIPGTLGATALLVFFFGHHVVQLAGLEEILIFALGVALLALEVFVIPGFGIAGIAGISLMVTSVVLSLLALDLRVSWSLGHVEGALGIVGASAALTVLGGVLVLRLLPGRGGPRFLVLKESLESSSGYSSHDEGSETAPAVGSLGSAISHLRPAGKIRVEGKRLDAVSEGGYVTEGSAVRIVAWRAGSAVVRPVTEDEDAAAGAGKEVST